MHRPFIVPYEKIGKLIKMDSADSDPEFTVEGIKIKMSGGSAEALKKKKQDPSIPIVSLKPGGDDAESSMERGERLIITRQRRFDELQYGFKSQVRDFFKSENPGDLEGTIRHCFETTCMERGSFLGIVYQSHTDLIITKEWFFWGVCDGDGCSSGCAKIKDIARNHDLEKILASNPMEIRGINISSINYDKSHPDSWNINTGNDKAGEDFRRELVKAVRKYANQH